MAQDKGSSKRQQPLDIKRLLLIPGGILLLLLVVALFGGFCRGAQGLVGPAGPAGETGPAGVEGPVGPQGDVTAVAGNPGDTGPIGETGATGAAGPQGELGGMGESGETGPEGLQGIQGEPGPQGEVGEQGPPGLTGPQGPLTYIKPPPGLEDYPIVSTQLFFVAGGFLMTDAAVAGTEPPTSMSRKVMDLRLSQAIRVQWAHSLADTLVKVRVQYYSGGWKPLMLDGGGSVGAYQPQTSAWGAVPKFLPSATVIRVLVMGNGEWDPKVQFVNIETK